MGKALQFLLLIATLAGSVTSEGKIISDTKDPYGPTDVKISGVDAATVGIPYGFACSASCSPPCKYTWTTDGQTVHGDELDLTLKSLVKSKVLKCEAQNPVSGRSASAIKTLRVTEGPSNVTITGPGSLEPGKAARFVCSANCYPSCNYFWFINGQKDNKQNSEKYVTASDWMDSLTLTCEAHNSVSGLFAAASEKLWVTHGPSDVQIKGLDTVALGVSYEFLCFAYCVPGCRYTWTVNGETKYGDKINAVFQQMTDSDITCEVQNTLSGKTVKVTKHLHVTDPVSVSPASATLPIANRPFTLRCMGVTEHASIQWVRNFDHLSTSNRVRLSAHNTMVTFDPLLQSDGGFFQCVATEGSVVIKSTGYEIYVNYGPVQAGIIQPYVGPVGKDFYLVLGSQSTLRCAADCYPACNYTWILKGKKVATGGSLSFSAVTPADVGTLTCVASNAITGNSSTAETVLKLPDGPHNVSISGPGTVDVGLQATFVCSAECSPSCSYTWTVYGKTMHGSKVDITFNRNMTSDVLTCEARNVISGSTGVANDTLHVIDSHSCAC